MNFPRSLLVLLVLSVCLVRPCALPAAAPNPITIPRITYHGWSGSVVLSNGLVEAVVVPAVGRVMQFRFVGSPDGPFWENVALLGGHVEAGSTEWANFGGDKAWPSPQSAWPRLIARDWPPPAGFDSLPMEVAIDGTAVMLISQIDPDYGIRVRRRIELPPGRPVMTISTRYEKIRGPAVEVAVWTITQLKDPAAVYALLPGDPRPDPTYVRQSDEPPPSLTVANGLLSLTRDPAKNHKIGVRSGTLVWVGATELLRLDSAVVAGARYPDDGSSAEVYTQSDPLPYVELEMLGPLEAMRAGDAKEHVTTYTLQHRTAETPADEIKGLLKP